MKAKLESKSFKIKAVRNIVLCVLPLSSFLFVKPEWLARLLAFTGFMGVINLLVLIYGLNPKLRFSVPPPPTDRKETEKEWRDRHAPRVVKVLSILSGCLLFWFVTISLIRDCVGASRQGRSYLTELEGDVTDNQGVLGSRLVTQSIVIAEKGSDSKRGYSAVFFRRIIPQGKTYRFLIAPKSGIVLAYVANG